MISFTTETLEEAKLLDYTVEQFQYPKEKLPDKITELEAYKNADTFQKQAIQYAYNAYRYSYKLDSNFKKLKAKQEHIKKQFEDLRQHVVCNHEPLFKVAFTPRQISRILDEYLSEGYRLQITKAMFGGQNISHKVDEAIVVIGFVDEAMHREYIEELRESDQ